MCDKTLCVYIDRAANTAWKKVLVAASMEGSCKEKHDNLSIQNPSTRWGLKVSVKPYQIYFLPSHDLKKMLQWVAACLLVFFSRESAQRSAKSFLICNKDVFVCLCVCGQLPLTGFLWHLTPTLFVFLRISLTPPLSLTHHENKQTGKHIQQATADVLFHFCTPVVIITILL